jgi:ADP-dependent NAD(P)H-hydrate dehydratase
MSPDLRPLDVEALHTWPLPAPGGDKNARGRVVVVGGSRRTPGAVLLAAEAALRVGAGKPQVATVESVASPASVALPEALVTALPETEAGEIDDAAYASVLELADGADALLLGPGLSSPDHATALLERIVPKLDCPVVVDALGMAYVTAHPDGLQHLSSRAILTPNTSELARTLERDEEEVEDDLPRWSGELARLTGATVVAGGRETFIAVAGSDVVWRHVSQVPGLAVAGSGDVKSGLVAGLLARGLEADGAAAWGVTLHEAAGRAVAAQGTPLGFLARELLPCVPREMAALDVAT